MNSTKDTRICGIGLGYVRCGGFLYELVDELPNLNGLIDHYKYVGCLVPPSQIPDALKGGASNA